MSGRPFVGDETPLPPDEEWPPPGVALPGPGGERDGSERRAADGGGPARGGYGRGGGPRGDGERGGSGSDRDGGGFERVPPQDLAAEQSVLGGMMLSKDAIADVVEILKPADYYRPAHEMIHNAILDLYSRGEPADPITVAAELTRRGEVNRVGGPGYLHSLVSGVPTAANAEYYAEIVHERAVLRRLVEAGTRIAQMGYAADGDVDEIVNRAQSEIYAVTEQRTSEDYAPLGDIMEGALDEIESMGSRSGQMSGVPTGFADLDSLTNGLHPGQMIVVAARPAMGKSTLALDFARSCSIRHKIPSVFFSLEMGRNEIAMRLLSAEARVALHHMRSGNMTDDDWTRLARRMPELNEAPLYIDDSPNLSMMEIRAKCRRLKQRNDLRLVVIDYLQLMQTGGSRRPESRQQEVSEMSRNLKLLAKELELPVIALSQLNRGPEQRTDKRPMVSDLRESGCVTAGTRLLRADTGAETTIGELLATGARDVPVWSVDDRLRLVARTLTHAFPSGVREVFRVRLASGREVEATANHPFLTYDGWQPLSALAVGARVAVPRRIAAPLRPQAWPEAEVVMLARLLGQGCAGPDGSVHCTSGEASDLDAVDAAAAHVGVVPRRVAHGSGWRTYAAEPRPLGQEGHPVAAWPAGLGLSGKGAQEAYLPAGVFALPDEQVRLFLRHLWAAGGSVAVSDADQVRVCFAASSERLAGDVQSLLLRLGVSARLRGPVEAVDGPRWSVEITEASEQRRFLHDVGVPGAGSGEAAAALRRLAAVAADTGVDTVPEEVWDRVRDAMRERGPAQRLLSGGPGAGSGGSAAGAPAPGPGRLARVARVLRDAELELLATGDVLWDPVVAVESLGEQPVFDATVLGTHNFVANGIVLHNSIEQDADMVILLHREDAYEKESPRAGEADLIVAKHRNGPTATITVAFQGHYSRFVDMAGEH